MDPLKIYQYLPFLENYQTNVIGWIEDLADLMRVCKIKDPEDIYTWAVEAVSPDIKPALKRLVVKTKDGYRYPTLKEIQNAVEAYLDITDADKFTNLQNLSINDDETIKSFNDRYRKLYHDLPRDLQKIISVKNYRSSIKSRTYPYSQVFVSKCDNLQEAYEIAEVAEDAEKEYNRTDNRAFGYSGSFRNNNMVTNVSMLTQQGYNRRVHPFFPRSNNVGFNRNNNYDRNNNGRFNGQEYYNNNFRNSNFQRARRGMPNSPT